MAETSKKDSLFQRIARWFREMKSELKKVAWPNGKRVLKNTLIVFACTLVVGLVIIFFDVAGEYIYKGILALASLLKG
ncbi:MAG: preprotein translocase subunit SecE [Oscillospiraceae bacterium]|nr:preprotein translocase subunit SecE [Oscillospiraceae bacterium]MBR2897390.1 preprotein translocase subunit SecE [Oscillospiraceae bacterium]MBR2977804.1 preprotein translocase subunit SecE [Oscillospiraceae bacterium]MBR3850093.1 preprotein translocase subunit SecE [Oscillospiraceae bacterium]